MTESALPPLPEDARAFFAKQLVELHKHVDGASELDTGVCYRGTVGAAIFSNDGKLMSVSTNTLLDRHRPCSCNDDTPTLEKGSPTCRAIHAEHVAIMGTIQQGKDIGKMYAMVTTRPPCQACIKLLATTPVVLLVTTDEYPDRDNSFSFWEDLQRLHVVITKEELENATL